MGSCISSPRARNLLSFVFLSTTMIIEVKEELRAGVDATSGIGRLEPWIRGQVLPKGSAVCVGGQRQRDDIVEFFSPSSRISLNVTPVFIS